MNDLLKRSGALILISAMLLAGSACSVPEASAGVIDTSVSSESDAQTEGLINHMTQAELAAAEHTEFQLLDHPWEKFTETKSVDSEYEGYKDKILVGTKYGAIVYGEPVFNAMLPSDYDGGAGEIVFLFFDAQTSQTEEVLIEFTDYEDLKGKLREQFDKEIEGGSPKVPTDEDYNTLITLYDAILSGKTESIDSDKIEDYLDYYYEHAGEDSQDSMYWEMDDAAVKAISGSINEYHFYDEELDLKFVVHVTTPPAYDPSSEYPALVLTDAVWRFKDVPALYTEMALGKALPQYLITIGFEYDIDSWDNDVRGNILCDHKKEFLDFISDNMMPYLAGEYKIDFSRSTLFGHSQGGVFAHYAAFNYDRYDNRPFGKYIVASPTFWTPYFTCVKDFEEYKDEYGFFDRNSDYGCRLFITAGELEDEDYEEYFESNDSTTEGVKHLAERLDSHGVDSYEVRLYNSHHYQYVGRMLKEYVEEFE